MQINMRVTYDHEQAIVRSNVGSDRVYQKNRLPWISPRSALAMVLLALLPKATPLHAQPSQSPLTVSQERSVSAELGDDQSLRAPDIGLGLNRREPSLDGSALPTVVPTESSPLPSAGFAESCALPTSCPVLFSHSELSHKSIDLQPDLGAKGDGPGETSKSPSVEVVRPPKPPDSNQNIYYKNRLEFGLDVGWLPINIPFVFDVFLGDGYTMTPLRYTLVPIIASVRWHMGDVAGPSFLRGNWDLSASASAVVIPRGPETRYYSWIMGIRRNFVQRNWKIAPYFDGRLGLGNIDAKEPLGVVWAQGQDFTFTVNLGSGVRYNFNPRYSISAGLNWMHISNLYLSEPRFPNYGINVYGPMFGIDIRIGKPHHHASE